MVILELNVENYQNGITQIQTDVYFSIDVGKNKHLSSPK